MQKKKIFLLKLIFSWMLVLSFFGGTNVSAFEMSSKLSAYSESLTASVLGTMGDFFDYVASFFSDEEKTPEPTVETFIPNYTMPAEENSGAQADTAPPAVVQVAAPVSNVDLVKIVREILNNEISYSGSDGGAVIQGPRGEVGPQGPEGATGPRGPSGSSSDIDVSSFVSKSLFDAQNNGTMSSIENGLSALSISIGEAVDTDLLTVSGAATVGGNLTVSGSLSSASFTNSALTETRVTFAGAAGLLSDDADLTFATDTLSATKLLSSTSVSTPSLISTGALTITPASGSNLNVSLATTGDFVVNTDDLYVDTSTGNVGINSTAPLLS